MRNKQQTTEDGKQIEGYSESLKSGNKGEGGMGGGDGASAFERLLSDNGK